MEAIERILARYPHNLPVEVEHVNAERDVGLSAPIRRIAGQKLEGARNLAVVGRPSAQVELKEVERVLSARINHRRKAGRRRIDETLWRADELRDRIVGQHAVTTAAIEREDVADRDDRLQDKPTLAETGDQRDDLGK